VIWIRVGGWTIAANSCAMSGGTVIAPTPVRRIVGKMIASSRTECLHRKDRILTLPTDLPKELDPTRPGLRTLKIKAKTKTITKVFLNRLEPKQQPNRRAAQPCAVR
jgi:hypothetical protein